MVVGHNCHKIADFSSATENANFYVRSHKIADFSSGTENANLSTALAADRMADSSVSYKIGLI
jgi:hypothetical protein